MNRIEKARLINVSLKRQKAAINETIPRMMTEGMIQANGDAAKARTFAASLGQSVELLEVRPWASGMITQPGELVYDPNGVYIYAYNGKNLLEHTNPTYFPGAAGVYYWSIIPAVKDGIKVYPDISGIIVAVRTNEVWWNTTKTEKFKWRGVDNANCVWPPIAGNEWEKVG
jgi:hypothetical protein